MKKQIEEYIPKALEALKTVKIVENGKYSPEYAGYIASFGPSVRLSGLLPTIAFYGREDAHTAEDRQKVGAAILKVITEKESELGKSLLNYVLEQRNRKYEIKSKILDSVIALKLALRTYTKSDKEEESAT